LLNNYDTAQLQEERISIAKLIKDALRSELMRTYICQPARVISYDADTQKASIELMIKKQYVYNDENGTSRPVLEDVPVFNLRGDDGNRFIHFPVEKDDLGTAFFCDRSLEVYLGGDGSKAQLPNDTRIHDISDAIFFAGVVPFAKALANVNNNDIIFKNSDLLMKLKKDGKISIANSSNELIAVIDELANWLKTAKVITSIGPMPFTADSLASLAPIILKLESFKV
jgi:hypothetical protein